MKPVRKLTSHNLFKLQVIMKSNKEYNGSSRILQDIRFYYYMVLYYIGQQALYYYIITRTVQQGMQMC